MTKVTRRHRSGPLAWICVFPVRAPDEPGPRDDGACAHDCFSGAALVPRPRAPGRKSRRSPILAFARQAPSPPQAVTYVPVHLRDIVASRVFARGSRDSLNDSRCSISCSSHDAICLPRTYMAIRKVQARRAARIPTDRCAFPQVPRRRYYRATYLSCYRPFLASLVGEPTIRRGPTHGQHTPAARVSTKAFAKLPGRLRAFSPQSHFQSPQRISRGPRRMDRA